MELTVYMREANKYIKLYEKELNENGLLKEKIEKLELELKTLKKET